MLNKKITSILLPAAVFLILSAVLLGSQTGVFAQNTTYPPAPLTDSGDVNFFLQTQAIEFTGGKWTYNFTWKRTRDAQGRLTIAPVTNEQALVVDVDPAGRERTSSNPLSVKLDPATRYVVKYFAAPSSSCDANLGQSDPECGVIRTIYFNTRNESGRVMSVSEIPISRGGNSIAPDTTTTTSGDQSIASLQAQINQLLAIVQTLLARLGGNTGIQTTPIAMCDYSPAPAGCSYVNGPNFNPTTQCGKVLQCGNNNSVPTNNALTILTRPLPSAWGINEPAGTQVVTAKIATSNASCQNFIICSNTGTAVCSNEQCPSASQAAALTNAKTMTVTVTTPPRNVCPTDTLRVCPNRVTAVGKQSSGAGSMCFFPECENNSKIVGKVGTCDPYPKVCPDGSLTYRNNLQNCSFDQCPASAPKTENVQACLASLGGKKFSPGRGVPATFSVSPQLAQEMKTWERCHYASGAAGFNHLLPDPTLNAKDRQINTVSLEEQRRLALACNDLFTTQARRLGFDSANCTMGEYCFVGDGRADSICGPNETFMGRETVCSLSKNGVNLFVGESANTVGNDFGASYAHAEPQSWFERLWTFNSEIARKSLDAFEATYDVHAKLYRPDIKDDTFAEPSNICKGVLNASVVLNDSKRGGTISWQAPSSVKNVSIYILGYNPVVNRTNDILVHSTLVENYPNKQGLNSYVFTMPPKNTFPIQSFIATPFNKQLLPSAIDNMVANARENELFVRVVADNGVFGDTIPFPTPTIDSDNEPDYGTRVNTPRPPSFTNSCENALATLDFNRTGTPGAGWTGNSNCSRVTSSMVDVGFPVTAAWYPGNFPNARMVLRVAEDNGGRGEAAVRGGCANPLDCFLKMDQVWGSNLYTQSYGDMAGGGVSVNGLKPGTRYWFRTAAVCNYGQANQVYKDEVWSCTTQPASGGACSNECSAGQTQCMANTRGVRQLCGNFDSDSCLEWGSGSVPGAEGVAFRFDSSCQ